MLPDAETISVISSILKKLDLGSPFCIKINNRKLLDAMCQLSGADSKKFGAICSAIDKLDKVKIPRNLCLFLDLQKKKMIKFSLFFKAC